ncbi:MAG TPA: AAA family ATPase [Fibrobacteria bacterium]|nr:AAA family ATPase [Fibrobacteria bacterium]
MTREELLAEFLKTWPLERIRSMTLEEYTKAGSRDTFCFWIEFRLTILGGIGGGSAFKFGIFNRKDRKLQEDRTGYRYSEDYAWHGRHGATPAEAFQRIRSLIVEAIEKIRLGDLEAIEEIDLSNVLKWKSAFLFQDFERPLIPMIFKDKSIQWLAAQRGEESRSLARCMRRLGQDWNREDDWCDFSMSLWKEWAIHAEAEAEDLEDTEDAEGPPSHWLLGATWGEEDMSEAFIKESRWENGYEERYLDKVRAIRPGDKVAIKAAYVRKNTLPFDNHGIPTGCMRIKARGVVLENPGDGRNLRIRWAKGFKPFEIYSWTWQSTVTWIDPAKYQNAIDWIWNDVPQNNAELEQIAARKAKSPVDDTTDGNLDDIPVRIETKELRKFACTNEILYGPPGTGKTYATRVRALALAGEPIPSSRDEVIARYEAMVRAGRILFTTFHPSLAYEEFIEGLRPVADSTAGQLRYEVQEGIFARLCSRARTAWIAWSRGTVAESFDALWASFVEEVERQGGVTVTTRGNTQFEVYEVDDGTIRFRKSNGNTQHTLSASTLRGIYDGTRSIAGGLSTYYDALVEHLKSRIEAKPELTSDRPEEFVLVIDEINRANISSVFGELITLLEPSKRMDQTESLEIVLPYSRTLFQVPPNLHVIGTMNTADRSVEALDVALRRRFEFVEMMPKPDQLKTTDDGLDLHAILTTINRRLEALLDRDHTIGHAFLLDAKSVDDVRRAFETKIVPLLQEFFYGEWSKIGMVIGSGFVRKSPLGKVAFAKGFDKEFEAADIYELIPAKDWSIEAFKGILSPG